MNHDHGYKLLFSHAEMVADLLRGFVKEDWVNELDFSTLEKINGSYISDDLRERQDDIIWRLRRKQDEWLYVYLLLEFQSTVDWFMAVRIMTYIGLLYQDLIRSESIKTGEQLPPVLPMVLYWTRRKEPSMPRQLVAVRRPTTGIGTDPTLTVHHHPFLEVSS